MTFTLQRLHISKKQFFFIIMTHFKTVFWTVPLRSSSGMIAIGWEGSSGCRWNRECSTCRWYRGSWKEGGTETREGGHVCPEASGEGGRVPWRETSERVDGSMSYSRGSGKLSPGIENEALWWCKIPPNSNAMIFKLREQSQATSLSFTELLLLFNKEAVSLLARTRRNFCLTIEHASKW